MTEPYRVTIARLRATKLPPALIGQHVKHGFTEGQTCATCDHFRAMWLHSATDEHRYCSQIPTYTSKWCGEWPACGKWRAKEAKAS